MTVESEIILMYTYIIQKISKTSYSKFNTWKLNQAFPEPILYVNSLGLTNLSTRTCAKCYLKLASVIEVVS